MEFLLSDIGFWGSLFSWTFVVVALSYFVGCKKTRGKIGKEMPVLFNDMAYTLTKGRNIVGVEGYSLRRLKSILRGYNTRTGQWN